MEKVYNSPELEIIKIELQDICTSSTMPIPGFCNNALLDIEL